MKRRRWPGRQAAADRLCRGSALLLRRWEQRLTAWVRAGRRDDLTGWRAALGPLLRIGVLAAAGLVAYSVLRAARGLMWLLTACWLLAAWRAGRGPAAPQEQPAEQPPAAADPAPVRALLEELIADRSGVHLSTLLAHLQERGHAGGWTVSDVRARAAALGIPVRRSVKVAGRVSWGVRRADLEPLPQPTEQTPSTGPSTAA